MHDTAAGGDLFVILLREGRIVAEISAQIQHSPALACSEKALPLGWQMPGTGRSAEISVYLIFSPPFTLDFSLLYVHKTPRQLISALWPLLIGLCERKAAPAGEITHTCYFELSCHFPSPCLQELQAPFCEPGLLYFHCHPQDQQEGPQVFRVVVLPLNSSRYREATESCCCFSFCVGRWKWFLVKETQSEGTDGPPSTYTKLLLTALTCLPVAPPSPSPWQHQEQASRCPAFISPSQETSSLFGQVSQRKKASGVKMWNTGEEKVWICQTWWIMQYLEDEEDT